MNKTAKNIIIRLSMFFGLAMFVFLAVMAKINREQSRIQKVKIGIDEWNGLFFVNKIQVLQLIENRFEVKGKILSGKELEQIEKAVRIIPQVKNSQAYTDDNGNLNIKIEQRTPLLRVYNLQGQSFYLDEKGVKFPVTSNYAAKVPVVTGNITEKADSVVTVTSFELKRIYNIVQKVNKNKLWSAMIGQYNINANGQVELIPRFGNCTVLFGDDKNIEQKIKRLDVFYFDVLKKVGWDYYKVINIMYKNQVVCLK
jgi:cell division protein FtsQ